LARTVSGTVCRPVCGTVSGTACGTPSVRPDRRVCAAQRLVFEMACCATSLRPLVTLCEPAGISRRFSAGVFDAHTGGVGRVSCRRWSSLACFPDAALGARTRFDRCSTQRAVGGASPLDGPAVAWRATLLRKSWLACLSLAAPTVGPVRTALRRARLARPLELSLGHPNKVAGQRANAPGPAQEVIAPMQDQPIAPRASIRCGCSQGRCGR
jgi:hypothetical protein